MKAAKFLSKLPFGLFVFFAMSFSLNAFGQQGDTIGELSRDRYLATRLGGPNISPYTSLSKIVGVDKLRVAYYAPRARGRKVWGDGGVVPYNTMWRVGANNSTVLSCTSDFYLESKKIQAGGYSIFIIPNEKEFTLVINSETSLWGAENYSKDLDVARFNIAPIITDQLVEELTINISNSDFQNATVTISWGNIQLPIKFYIDNNEKIINSLSNELQAYANQSTAWDLYLEAVDYCIYSGKNLDQGLEWANKALALQENYSTYFAKARLLALNKQYGEAINLLDKASNWLVKEGQANADNGELAKLKSNWKLLSK